MNEVMNSLNALYILFFFKSVHTNYSPPFLNFTKNKTNKHYQKLQGEEECVKIIGQFFSEKQKRERERCEVIFFSNNRQQSLNRARKIVPLSGMNSSDVTRRLTLTESRCYAPTNNQLELHPAQDKGI